MFWSGEIDAAVGLCGSQRRFLGQIWKVAFRFEIRATHVRGDLVGVPIDYTGWLATISAICARTVTLIFRLVRGHAPRFGNAAVLAR